MNTMKHAGYIAKLTVDADVGTIHGEVINTQAVLTFSASNVGDLKSAFADTIADYVAWCAEDGLEPERGYSGTISLRLPPDLHRQVAEAASLDQASLNAFIVAALQRAVTDDTPPKQAQRLDRQWVFTGSRPAQPAPTTVRPGTLIPEAELFNMHVVQQHGFEMVETSVSAVGAVEARVTH